MDKSQKKVGKVMKEFKEGKLHTGKPGKGKGPVVKSRKQAIAIAMSEAGMAKKMKDTTPDKTESKKRKLAEKRKGMKS